MHDPALNTEDLLQQLASQLQRAAVSPSLRWIRALVRTALKDLGPQLDATQFAQVHRSVIVNLRAVSHVTRSDNETAEIHLKGRPETLPVSRNYLHVFRQT